MANNYYIYIMANKSRTIYVGVTNDLIRRVKEHQDKIIPGFTKKYNLKNLVYYETAENPYSAIMREKQIKSWRRNKKIKLIESVNPSWRDLSKNINS